jgi:hypothetical protein
VERRKAKCNAQGAESAHKYDRSVEEMGSGGSVVVDKSICFLLEGISVFLFDRDRWRQNIYFHLDKCEMLQ